VTDPARPDRTASGRDRSAAELVAVREDGLELSTDPGRLDLDRIHRWLSVESYWAASRPRDVVERSIAGSLSVGVYDGDIQIAYGRVVTDRATFAWICDVFVDDPARGRGIGGWLMRAIVDHLHSLGVYRMLLATRDAHEVYRGFGFEPLPDPTMWMIRTPRRG
jgi:GNAT superfamily N-acetyltransferase